MPATYEPIATTTLGSAAASITFSSIASSWTDLRLVLVGTGSSAVNAIMRFNSDTATNYSQTYIYGDGASAASTRLTTQTYVRLTGNGGISTTIPQMWTVDIFSYAGSTFKTSLVTASEDNNGSGNVERIVGLWRSTAAITSVLVSPTSGNWNIGTTATLYGIKNA